MNQTSGSIFFPRCIFSECIAQSWHVTLNQNYLSTDPLFDSYLMNGTVLDLVVIEM